MLEEFLLNGNFGPVRLGQSRVEVTQMLGEPMDYSEKSRKVEIWKYDQLEVTFTGDSLYLIGLYPEHGLLKLPTTLVEEGQLTIREKTVTEFENLLLVKDIDFIVVKPLTFDEYRTILLTKSRVSASFYEGRLTALVLSRDNVAREIERF